MSKYFNIKQNGFDSRKEEARFAELRLLERAGVITDLKRQVPIELLPPQYVDGDVKSEITRKNKDYIIKRKLLLYIHGIRLRET